MSYDKIKSIGITAKGSRIAYAIAGMLILCVAPFFSQEALLSTAENYYEFQSLFGNADRPYLNYRTLSDSTWEIKDRSQSIWEGNVLGTKRELSKSIAFRVYGPEFFSSYNSACPYGQNDGALWQGKGLNASLSGGGRVEAYGFEVTLKPQIAFSQNQSFDTVKPAYAGPAYAGKADTYGYYGIPSIDAPQRFGDDPLYAFSWGDSEIRYSWKTLTIGFGTQAIWLGPAKINPILHSNNATAYPKLDIGLRRQNVSVLGCDLGDVETRLWWGRTTESDFFDKDDGNDHNLITGFTFSYAPSIIRGLTLGLHRTMISRWKDRDYKSTLTILVPMMSTDAGSDSDDQRASITASYLLPSVGLEIYLEWAKNDFSPSEDYLVRYPFHTQAYTLGLTKAFSTPVNTLKGEVTLEVTNLESSRDYELLSWGTTFYSHGFVSQGYTNGGQWLGAGTGTGGNCQSLHFSLLYPRGKTTLSLVRRNPDLDSVWFSSGGEERQARFRADLTADLNGVFWYTKNLSTLYGLSITDSHNYDYAANSMSIHRYNVGARLGAAYTY